jgi:hypothetical protein
VVFVRGFEGVRRSDLVVALGRVGVPCARFTDDDLTALHGEQPGFAFYSETQVREFAARMAILIGTTPALCARLASFHPKVLHLAERAERAAGCPTPPTPRGNKAEPRDASRNHRRHLPRRRIAARHTPRVGCTA